MKAWLALLLVVVTGAGCRSGGGGQPPNPQPTPTPAASMLLSRSGKVFTDAAGKPFDLKVNTSCCWTDDGEPDPGWALASRAFIDRIAGFGFNWIHVRLGPYRVQPDWGPEQIAAGSPYLEVGGKADLTQWNPTFWAYVDGFITYGKTKKVGFEVDLIDGWGVKWQKWRPNQFPQGHPFVKSSNAQNQDWITPAGTRAIVPGDAWYAWIEKIVEVAGKHDNVFYQVGNENGQIPGITADWEISSCNAVHAAEAKFGYPRHLCGSNVPELVANRAEIDFLTVHDALPVTQAQGRDSTRPVRNNEVNIPYTGQQWYEFFCAAKKAGTYLDFWRAEIRRPEAEKAWTLAQSGCAAAPDPGCSKIPNEDSQQVLPKPAPKTEYVEALNAAMKRLKPDCGVGTNCAISTDMQTWLQSVAAEVRQGDATHPKLCAAVQQDAEGPVDELCIGTEQECQGFHAYACRPGCATGTVGWGPGSARDSWRKPGGAVSATSSSGAADPKREPDYRWHRDKIEHRGRPAVQP